MNLPPTLVGYLTVHHGLTAVHWSAVGDHQASDQDILAWTRVNSSILITHDLGFAAILVAGGGRLPSVIQLRTRTLIVPALAELIARVVTTHRRLLKRGALLSVDDNATRIRMLPLRRK